MRTNAAAGRYVLRDVGLDLYRLAIEAEGFQSQQTALKSDWELKPTTSWRLQLTKSSRREGDSMKILFPLFVTVWLACAGTVSSQVPDPLYGLTIDSIKNLPDIVASLGALQKKPTTRIVFDEKVPASEYVEAVNEIKKVSYIMGEILDSFPMHKYSVKDYINRTHDYLDTFGDKVDIWEIGNEINGDWLGKTTDVVAKVTGTYDIIKNAGKTTELTLYYNADCVKKPANEMFTWVQANIPSRMMTGLDYVLVSYYEDDCKGLQPDWPSVYRRLAALFPNSKVGFGECGTKYKARKEPYVRRYYGLKIDAPRYVGGYFWWYYKQDMVPKTKPLWEVINTAMSGY